MIIHTYPFPHSSAYLFGNLIFKKIKIHSTTIYTCIKQHISKIYTEIQRKFTRFNKKTTKRKLNIQNNAIKKENHCKN